MWGIERTEVGLFHPAGICGRRYPDATNLKLKTIATTTAKAGKIPAFAVVV